MTFEPKPGDGALFPNDRKTSDKAPDHTGYILAHRDVKRGEKLNLAGWTKKSSRGEFISIRVSDVRGREDKAERPKLDDESPFL